MILQDGRYMVDFDRAKTSRCGVSRQSVCAVWKFVRIIGTLAYEDIDGTTSVSALDWQYGG